MSEIQIETPVTNIHEALADAAAETSESKPMIPISTKLPEELAATVKEICARHGTNTSTFLRKCCESLVKDYQA